SCRRGRSSKLGLISGLPGGRSYLLFQEVRGLTQTAFSRDRQESMGLRPYRGARAHCDEGLSISLREKMQGYRWGNSHLLRGVQAHQNNLVLPAMLPMRAT